MNFGLWYNGKKNRCRISNPTPLPPIHFPIPLGHSGKNAKWVGEGRQGHGRGGEAMLAGTTKASARLPVAQPLPSPLPPPVLTCQVPIEFPSCPSASVFMSIFACVTYFVWPFPFHPPPPHCTAFIKIYGN